MRTVGLLLPVIALLGCQAISLGPGGRVSEEDRISLVQSGKASGSWSTRDLMVDYRYVRSAGKLDLSGRVIFSSVVTGNFSLINYFHLDAIFLDEKGNVIEMAGLLSSANSDPNSVEPFSVALSFPAGASFIAFSYQGQAHESSDGGGGSWSYIWHYPIH